MLASLLILLGIVLPVAIYFYTQMQNTTPSLRWPKVAPMVKLTYAADPPRMSGQWNGKDVVVSLENGQAVVTATLSKPSRLRVEIGPKDLVTKRAGMVLPDAVVTGDEAFDEKFVARCSDKNEGPAIVDPVLRQRILAQPQADVVGQGQTVRWTGVDANDPDLLEGALDVVSVIAAEMERFS
jgi:hypothetical protein